MKKLLFLLPCLVFLTPVPAPGQSTDMAAERARIADQRIQAEAARIAGEEDERQRQAEAQARAQEELPAARAAEQPGTQAAPVKSTSPPDPVIPDADMSTALEQIRTLGELKDAGYLTDEEFARIKSRILDSNF